MTYSGYNVITRAVNETFVKNLIVLDGNTRG